MIASQTLFIWIVGIIIVNFLLDRILEYLNARRFGANLPPCVQDIYSSKDYTQAQAYKRQNYRLSVWSSLLSFVLLLSFLTLGGFGWLDSWVRNICTHPVWIGLLYFGILIFVNNLITIPFGYYRNFVIEANFGFNKMTKKLFILDTLKSWILSAILGGVILTFAIGFYTWTGNHFWWYAWILVVIFIILMHIGYTRWIVPLFNTQTPLPQGNLHSKIISYTQKVHFQMDNIYIIDGSKRSTKANAYFSGLGKSKRINLYDTLLDELTEEEVIGVLAHEVGHYQKRHTWYHLLLSILSVGLTLYLLSLCVGVEAFSYALGAEVPSFHIGLISFALLYSPISTLTGVMTHGLSRIFEYQADDYARKTFGASPLISALKKLSKHSLSNLTPHPAYVFVNYSHPPLYRRIQNLKR